MRAMMLDSSDLIEAWSIEDQYRLGTDILVAPLLRSGRNQRRVWLPPGGWVDWFTGTTYTESGWVTLEAANDDVPIIVLARVGSAIPLAPVAQHTGAIDWAAVSPRRFPAGNGTATGWYRGPDDEDVNTDNGMTPLGVMVEGDVEVVVIVKATLTVSVLSCS